MGQLSGGAGRRVVVTGASSGIGRASVAALAEAGFAVIATVRKQADADALAAEHGDAVSTLLVDVVDQDAVRAAGESVVGAGPLFALVNNAGTAVPGPLEHQPIDDFRRQLEINLVGQVLMTQVMLPALRRSAEESGDARIVMIGSIGGRVTGPMLGAYQASKHGMVGVSGAFRAELAPSGIAVVLIEPGAIATPIWHRGADAESWMDTAPADVRSRYAAQVEGARRMAQRGATKGLPPSVPARAVVRALTDKRPAPRVVVGRDAAMIAAMVRVLPFRTLYRLSAARR